MVPDLELPSVDITALVALGPLMAIILAGMERFIPVIPSYVLFVAMGSLLVGDIDSLILITLLSAAGATAGSAVWFTLGSWLGADRCRAFVARQGKWFLLSIGLYDALIRRFSRNASLVVFVAQTIPTVRIAIALPAGVIGMPWRPYLLATFCGCIVWNGSLITVGMLLQQSDIAPWLAIAGIIGVVIALEAGVLIFMKVRRRRLTRQAGLPKRRTSLVRGKGTSMARGEEAAAAPGTGASLLAIPAGQSGLSPPSI